MAARIVDFVKKGTKIVCVGRNYAKHAKELGNAVPSEPIIFMKPTSCYLEDGGDIIYPKITKDLHYEIELGVIIGKTASKVGADKIMDHVSGYAIALDLTARDIQEKCKQGRMPWTMAKCLDTFCPIGCFVEKDKIDHCNTEISLKINGEVRQHGNTKDMVFSVPALIEYINQSITLYPGDLILTGTPEGVGPIHPGDTLTASIPNITEATFYVKAE